jgi:hypothetical protein
MEVRGQLHTPAALLPGEDPRYPRENDVKDIWVGMDGEKQICDPLLCLKVVRTSFKDSHNHQHKKRPYR